MTEQFNPNKLEKIKAPRIVKQLSNKNLLDHFPNKALKLNGPIPKSKSNFPLVRDFKNKRIKKNYSENFDDEESAKSGWSSRRDS